MSAVGANHWQKVYDFSPAEVGAPPNYRLEHIDSTAAPVEELLPILEGGNGVSDGGVSGGEGGEADAPRRAVGVQVVSHRSRLAASRLTSTSGLGSAGDLAALRMRSMVKASVFGQRLRLKAAATRLAKQASDVT